MIDLNVWNMYVESDIKTGCLAAKLAIRSGPVRFQMTVFHVSQVEVGDGMVVCGRVQCTCCAVGWHLRASGN